MVRRLLLTDPGWPIDEITTLTGRDATEVRRMIASVRRRYGLTAPSRRHEDRASYYECRAHADIQKAKKLRGTAARNPFF